MIIIENRTDKEEERERGRQESFWIKFCFKFNIETPNKQINKQNSEHKQNDKYRYLAGVDGIFQVNFHNLYLATKLSQRKKKCQTRTGKGKLQFVLEDFV